MDSKVLNPKEHYCPNSDCSAYGQTDMGNITVHSRKEGRLRCGKCGKTFAATTGTPLYRVHKDHQLYVWVIILLAFGCPVEAIHQAFGLDRRTIADWQAKSGHHCQRVHEATVLSRCFDLIQVQLDEIRHKVQGGIIWVAMAIVVPTRLWLGAVVSRNRDKTLITAIVAKVRLVALARPLLLCFDGLVTYVKACQKAFRSPLHTRERGRPRLISWPNICLGQVVKQYAKRIVVGVDHRIVQGSKQMIRQLIQASQKHGCLNTAFIERLNATFRSRLAALTRRTRHLLRKTEQVENALYLVGCVYNFCTPNDALRIPLYLSNGASVKRRWVTQTPAMAARITDHQWTMLELLTFKIPPKIVSTV